jgi:type I thyroxine 5'-deiodinase
MYEAFRDRAAFYVVYIAEAHAEDGWQTSSNRAEGVVIRQHTTLAERRHAAQRCARELGLTIPMLLDSMEDAACRAFSAWPERIYVVGADGRIAYQGGHGPFDFDPDGARAALQEILTRYTRPESSETAG